MAPKATMDVGIKNTFTAQWRSGPGCVYRKRPICQLDYSRHSKCTATCDTLNNVEESKGKFVPKHAKNLNEGAELRFLSFLTSALCAGELSAVRRPPLCSRGESNPSSIRYVSHMKCTKI